MLALKVEFSTIYTCNVSINLFNRERKEKHGQLNEMRRKQKCPLQQDYMTTHETADCSVWVPNCIEIFIEFIQEWSIWDLIACMLTSCEQWTE